MCGIDPDYEGSVELDELTSELFDKYDKFVYESTEFNVGTDEAIDWMNKPVRDKINDFTETMKSRLITLKGL